MILSILLDRIKLHMQFCTLTLKTISLKLVIISYLAEIGLLSKYANTMFFNGCVAYLA